MNKILLVGVLLLLGVGTAQASSDDVIHACARNESGALRIADTCRRSEYPVQWGQQGPQGAPGQSASDLSFKVLSNTVPTSEASYVLACPDQGTALAGVAWVNSDQPVLPLIEGSFVSLDLSEWQGEEITLTYYVTCVTTI